MGGRISWLFMPVGGIMIDWRESLSRKARGPGGSRLDRLGSRLPRADDWTARRLICRLSRLGLIGGGLLCTTHCWTNWTTMRPRARRKSIEESGRRRGRSGSTRPTTRSASATSRTWRRPGGLGPGRQRRRPAGGRRGGRVVVGRSGAHVPDADGRDPAADAAGGSDAGAADRDRPARSSAARSWRATT